MISGTNDARYLSLFCFQVIWVDQERDFVLQVILAGAFYPNYFVKRPVNTENQEDNAVRNLNALDPLKTVYMRGWPINQPGYLYVKRLQEIFSQHHGVPQERIMISFDGSMRVYVQYCEKETPNSDEGLYRISDFVYTCVKMRHCEVPIKIGLVNATYAHGWSDSLKLSRFEKMVFFNKKKTRQIKNHLHDIRPELPGLDVTLVPLFIQNVSSISLSLSSFSFLTMTKLFVGRFVNDCTVNIYRSLVRDTFGLCWTTKRLTTECARSKLPSTRVN